MPRAHVSGDRAARKLLIRCREGEEASLMDYLAAAVIFIFIVAVLVTLWRREHRGR